jgi:hypothetical protein
MFQNMANLIDHKKAPHVVALEMENGSRVVLLKCKEDGGDDTNPNYFWSGHPVGTDGRHCPFGLVVRNDGRAIGGASLNFMAEGRWTRGQQKPSRDARENVNRSLTRGFIASVLMNQGKETPEHIRSVLEAESGFKVSEGRFTKKDRLRAALCGIRPAFVAAVDCAGLRFAIDVKEVVEKRLKDGFAAVKEGPWDQESQELSVTSALGQSIVHLLKEEGLCLHRPERKGDRR